MPAEARPRLRPRRGRERNPCRRTVRRVGLRTHPRQLAAHAFLGERRRIRGLVDSIAAATIGPDQWPGGHPPTADAALHAAGLDAPQQPVDAAGRGSDAAHGRMPPTAAPGPTLPYDEAPPATTRPAPGRRNIGCGWWPAAATPIAIARFG